jgi:hypothetical protein
MSEITINTFEEAVAGYFEPLAREFELPLIRAKENLYEIASRWFIMRISFGIGHGRSILATLSPSGKSSTPDLNDRNEFGIAVVAGYNGMEMQTRPVGTTEEFFNQAQYVADMARTFGIPYLLGQKSDWNDVKEYIEEKIEREAEGIKKLKFPPNVQKRWHLPPPGIGESQK